MGRSATTLLQTVAFACICLLAHAVALAQGAAPSRLIGIDHMPLAVKDVERAADQYRRLGFAIKPGRHHDNSIRTALVKFPDGSGIELITASKDVDPLAASYVQLLAQGEGPAFLGFHARDFDRFLGVFAASGIRHSGAEEMHAPLDPRMSFIFFVQDNRSKTDRPAHFAHPNTAVAMSAVWIATGDAAPFRQLLTALGAVESEETVFIPKRVKAAVFSVENGKVILLPEALQLIKGRPIVGASFRVASLDAAGRVLASANVSPLRTNDDAGHVQLLVAPAATSGIWLAFSEH
jgi:catechol 2,3-dioxygenase-like lactoylglutathione lyase family enzyme